MDYYNERIDTYIYEYLSKFYSKDILNKHFYEWINIIHEILFNDEFQKRNFMEHHPHPRMTVIDHSSHVSFDSFLQTRKKRMSLEIQKNVAIAGELHDFYTKGWIPTEKLELLGEPYNINFTDKKPKEKWNETHFFSHPKDALKNSQEYFPHLLNEVIEDAILRHMFPINSPWIAPKFTEGKIVCITDTKLTLNIVWAIFDKKSRDDMLRGIFK